MGLDVQGRGRPASPEPGRLAMTGGLGGEFQGLLGGVSFQRWTGFF